MSHCIVYPTYGALTPVNIHPHNITRTICVTTMNPITNLNFSTMMNNKNTTGTFLTAEDVLETLSPAYDQMNQLVAEAYSELAQINLSLDFEKRRVNECSTPSERFEVAEAVVFFKVRRDQVEAKCKSLETIRLDLYMAMVGLRG